MKKVILSLSIGLVMGVVARDTQGMEQSKDSIKVYLEGTVMHNEKIRVLVFSPTYGGPVPQYLYKK